MIRDLRANEVQFTCYVEDEDMPFQGNVSVSGNEADDKDTEDWVQAQLNQGNQAAWCYMKVTADWQGFRGTAGLGGCSYKSESEMKDDLLPQLQSEALADLNEHIKKIYNTISVLVQYTEPPRMPNFRG